MMHQHQQPSGADLLLPDSMYGSAGGDMGLGHGLPEMPYFPASLSPGPIASPEGISLQAAQQLQQQLQHQAQLMSMMYPIYGHPMSGMQAAAMAQAAALGMGGYPGMIAGMSLPPPFPNPAYLMAGMYGQQQLGGGGPPVRPLPVPFPIPTGLPPDYTAYHQMMMEMYSTMAQGVCVCVCLACRPFLCLAISFELPVIGYSSPSELGH
jgi:hypothetical protein